MRLLALDRAAVILASTKVAAALVLAAALMIDPDRGVDSLRALMLATSVVFAGTAAVLLAGSHRDRRASLLGIVLLLEASAFADRLVDPFRSSGTALIAVTRALMSIQVDALAPYFLWRFIEVFPRVFAFGWSRDVVRALQRFSLGVGLVLLLANVAARVADIGGVQGVVIEYLEPLLRDGRDRLYWPLVLGLSVIALPTLIARARLASEVERRRVTSMVAGLVVLVSPGLVWAFLAEFLPFFAAWFPHRWILYIPLLAAPIWTAYAVMVHRALDVRLVLRRAVRYALERRIATVLALLPAAFALRLLWTNRDLTLSALALSWAGLAVAALLGLSLLTLRFRRSAFERIDRRFFREQYDARRILGQMVAECRRAQSGQELAAILRREVDRALHVDGVRLLVHQAAERELECVDGEISSLHVDSELARQVARSPGGLQFTEDMGSAGLPVGEVLWVVDAAARLIVPLANHSGALIGAIVLGEKRSELAYSPEDFELMLAVAEASSMALDRLASGDTGRRVSAVGGRSFAERAELAAECPSCGLLWPAGLARCDACGSSMTRSAVPQLVAGKFRLSARIGAGSMGVVYRGVDLVLDREVAVKTLPLLRPEETWRLRREARALAAVVHPNLAMIYGVESWHGTPMLILEYLSGGSLAEKLRTETLSVGEALRFGMLLSNVCGAMHARGVIHRDIKPSNIGFTAGGEPKLLDFGLARLLVGRGGAVVNVEAARSIKSAAHRQTNENAATTTTDGQLVGTPLYMSPEAVDGMDPDPSFDTWSICALLFEAIAGVPPFKDAGVESTLRRIRSGNARDIRDHLPDTPVGVREMFQTVFSPLKRSRPLTSSALSEVLSALSASLSESELSARLRPGVRPISA